jgi:predicted esterase
MLSSQSPITQTARQGRLTARPLSTGHTTVQAHGLQSLDLDHKRDALLFVPSTYRPDEPLPLVVSLHGAGGNAEHGLGLLQEQAEKRGFLLLSPPSRQRTWDVIMGDYGPDVLFIDHALQLVFERYAVDKQHLAIGGFSDGASYALSLGIANGDLFTHVIAFSPGFMAPATQEGKAGFYISHGTHDKVLPIERCSRKIVPQLQRAGYAVQYHEFNGPHTVPPAIAHEAVDWWQGTARL